MKVKDRYDCIVIGAGGIGSAAAYHLSRDGKRVLLLEQHEVGHVLGSSHGESRVIRYVHDTPDYASQIPATFALWRQLERECGQKLLQMTGGLFMGPPDEPYMTGIRATMEELNFQYEINDSTRLRSLFPQFRVPEGWVGMTQENTGILAASRCVRAMVDQAIRHGAALLENTRVTEILSLADSGSDDVAVTASGKSGEDTFHADKVILCAGPWAPRFLEKLLPEPIPLRVTHQQVVYYPAVDPDAFALGRLPVFLFAGEDTVYGMPVWEREGAIKISLEQEERTQDPDDEVRSVDAPLLERLNAFVSRHLPGIIPEPLNVETCLYTETSSKDFIVDRHPVHPEIILAAGFSGKGFKHTIAVGRLLADLAAGEAGEYQSEFWRDLYRIARATGEITG